MPQSLQQHRREQALFAGLAALYAIVLGVLFALGHFGFVWKTLVIPSFFVVAALARRFRGFVRDWSVFLGALMLFDSFRGVVFAAIVRFDLPVYMGYAIDWERALFGGALPSQALQQVLFADGQIGTLERSLVAVHASHYVVFLGFGLLVWLVRAAWFPRLTFSLMLVMGLGMAGYLLVPTVPPWMAAEQFQVVGNIVHVSSDIYNVSLPNLWKVFDLNPIAAMPSLHTAFPVLLTLFCFRLFGRWGVVMLAYCATVVFAIVYMGEHYVVDVLAGVVLAMASYFAAFRWRRLQAWLDRAGEIAAGPVEKGALVRPVALTAVLLALTVMLGMMAQRSFRRFVPNDRFIARELEGKSPLADYYRAALSHRGRDFRTSQPLLARSLPAIRDSALLVRAKAQLAEAAYYNGDYETAVNAFNELARLSRRQAEMLARAKAELARPYAAR